MIKKFIIASLFLSIILAFSYNLSAENIEVEIFSDELEVLNYQLASGIYGHRDEVISSIELKNLFETEKEYWLGYSIRDDKGNWYDIPAKPFTLDRNERDIIEQSWRVPGRAKAGSYDLYFSIWDDRPGQRANRLVNIIAENAFEISDGTTDSELDFSGLDLEVASHSLGRGRFRAENVELDDDYLVLRSGENNFDGAEVRTTERLGYGSYTVKLKSDYAPGSFTAFFLYQDVEEDNDEIDIEIHNDESGKIDFVTFNDGEKSNFKQVEVDFNPTEDFYEYRIDYYPEQISFYVEGEKLAEFDSDLPSDEMKLMINHWWPNWLEADENHQASRVYIEQLTIDN